MRVRHNRFSAAAAAIAAAIFLAGCGIANAGSSPQASGFSGPPIVIGISLPLTGAFSADGQAFERGYQLWQTVVNNNGGLLGRPVQLIIRDDQSDPNKTASDYNTLITADHVDLTFGPFSSLLTIPAEAAVAPHGYAMIEGAGAAETVFTSPANQKYRNLFSPSLPVASYMSGFDAWIKAMPAGLRPTTAAYPTVIDPFATPAIITSMTGLSKAGVKTVYYKQFNEVPSAYPPAALAVARAKPGIVVLGCTDVPTVAEFMKVLAQQGWVPKVFIAVSGPDQGAAFYNAVGYGNADGMMVPGGWSGSYANALSYAMVEQYIARYGGNAASVNADVAEAYSVGEVAADAITATKSVDNAKIISYLHSSGTTLQSVQGAVHFDPLGRNPKAAAFVFQWQGTNFNQVLPLMGSGLAAQGSVAIKYPKPNWGV